MNTPKKKQTERINKRMSKKINEQTNKKDRMNKKPTRANKTKRQEINTK